MAETEAAPKTEETTADQLNSSVDQSTEFKLEYDFEVLSLPPPLTQPFIELPGSLLRKLQQRERSESLQQWLTCLRFWRETSSISLLHFRAFHQDSKAQPGILQGEEENARDRLFEHYY